jgi:hypothetical protein
MSISYLSMKHNATVNLYCVEMDASTPKAGISYCDDSRIAGAGENKMVRWNAN